MNWNVINISDEQAERIFYYLDGDVAKNFEDMNMVVKDEDDRELEMLSLNVNKPSHKEFYVKFRRPLKPRQKGRWTKLEYDWEEPERHYCPQLGYNLLTVSISRSFLST